jgi:DNA polymerase elongation subunit (family B)
MEKKIGTLIKVITSKRRVRENVDYDSLLLIYRDENGKKQTKFIDRAEVPFYVIKDKESPEAVSPPMFIERSKVDKINTFSDLLYREIAVKTDSLYYYDRVTTSPGIRDSNLKNLFKHNWLYDADMDFADRYIANFHEEFQPDINYKLHKCYFDIEVDMMPDGWKKDSKGNIGYMGFPDEEIAPVPVNIITLLDEKSMVIHTFVVKNQVNLSLVDFEKTVERFKVDLKTKLETEDLVMIKEIDIKFFNTEEETIQAFFKKAHEVDPDFMLAWNESFDVITLQNRLRKIYSRKAELKAQGIRPQDAMVTTISDSKYLIQKDRLGNTAYIPPRAYYMTRKDQSFVDRTDYFDVVDGINWMDQMLYYAGIRKTQGQKESYALDAVAYEELNKEKLEFAPGETIKTLPWTNFSKFAEYNIRDVILLYLIEDKNLDMDMLQRLSEITNTRKEKVFRKTVSLKNFVSKYANDNGFVMGNNKNSKYGDDSEYYEKNYMSSNELIEHDELYKSLFEMKENFGGFVADPNLNKAENGIKMNGKPSKFLYANVFDMDFASLYPSIIRAFNLDKNTQIGKFYLTDQHIKAKLISEFGYNDLFAVSKNTEATMDYEDGEDNLVANDGSTEDLGTTLVDSIMSFDFVRIGEKYFDLPSTEELIKELNKRNRK